MDDTVGGATRPRWKDPWARNLFGAWHERRVARRACEESLRLYRQIEQSQPELTDLGRYERLVAARAGLDAQGAREVLRRAEDSFASWPVERPLKLRDVVQYLVVQECLSADPAALGARSRLLTVVAEVIPDDL